MDATYACQRGFRERASQRFGELGKLVPNDEKLRELRQRCE